jgi:hypothetical protein
LMMNTTKWIPKIVALAVLAALLPCVTGRAQNEQKIRLHNPYVEAVLERGSITRLRVDPAGKGRMGDADFVRDLRPEGWEATAQTRTTASEDAQNAVIGPLQVWQPEPLSAAGRGAPMEPDKLLPGETLTQTFQIAEGAMLEAVSARLPTWNTKTSGATLRLYKGNVVLAERVLRNSVDNDWPELRPKDAQGAGEYKIVLSDPVGEIGWWRWPDAMIRGGGQARRGDTVLSGAHAFRASVRRIAGTGTLRLQLQGPDIIAETTLAPAPGITLAAPHPAARSPGAGRQAGQKTVTTVRRNPVPCSSGSSRTRCVICPPNSSSDGQTEVWQLKTVDG